MISSMITPANIDIEKCYGDRFPTQFGVYPTFDRHSLGTLWKGDGMVFILLRKDSEWVSLYHCVTGKKTDYEFYESGSYVSDVTLEMINRIGLVEATSKDMFRKMFKI